MGAEYTKDVCSFKREGLSLLTGTLLGIQDKAVKLEIAASHTKRAEIGPFCAIRRTSPFFFSFPNPNLFATHAFLTDISAVFELD